MRMTARRPIASIAATVACALLGSSSATAHAVDGSQAISYLNQQRNANGIPSVSVNQMFASAWCPDEDNGPAGGESDRVWSPRTDWGADHSPWDDAPLHQFAMYQPRYTEAGDVNVGGQACMGLGAPAPDPARAVFYMFAYENGPDAVPTHGTGYEAPFAPQQLIGIPQMQQTGPQPLLYVLGLAEPVRALSVTLTTASGQRVDASLVDNAVTSAHGYPDFLTDGGVLIPIHRLAPRTTYHGQVVWQDANGQQATQTFAFTTRLEPRANRVGFALRGTRRGLVLVVRSSAPHPRLVLSNAGRKRRVRLVRNRSRPLKLPRGRWSACVSSGGGLSGYAAVTRCWRFTL